MRARYKRYEYVMHTEYNSNALPVPIMEPRLSPAQASFCDANSKHLWVLSERSVLGVSESTVRDRRLRRRSSLQEPLVGNRPEMQQGVDTPFPLRQPARVSL